LHWLYRFVSVKPAELKALLYSFAYFFCLLCGYYVLRPVRDEMGIQGGVENLQWLFTATFIAMLCTVPVFGWASSRFTRAKLLPAVYGFFISNIVIFYFLSRGGLVPPQYLARVFFVWVSVFNLFVVSVFWSFMVDLFDSEQAKRLFGFIAAGGSAGAVAGPALTGLLVGTLGPINLLLVSALFLGMALFCVYRLRGWARRQQQTAPEALGGGIFDGVRRVVQSPYLLGIGAYILLYTMISTFLYFTQAEIVRDAFTESSDRTRIFAMMDLVTNGLTIGLQVFVTGRIARRWGLPVILTLVPAIVIVGFAVLGFYPVLIVLICVQVLRRAGNYAIARPGREMLFSVLAREDKYKSKNFVDTVVYRGGDAVSGWAYAGLTAMGMMASGIAAVGAVVAAVWLVIGWKLGQARRRMEPSDTRDSVTAVQDGR
jgi:AAA family ATP:ADP antiporter